MFNHIVTETSSEMTDFSLLMHAGLLQSLSPLKPAPLLQSTTSSHLGLPPSNQQPMHRNIFSLSIIRYYYYYFFIMTLNIVTK